MASGVLFATGFDWMAEGTYLPSNMLGDVMTVGAAFQYGGAGRGALLAFSGTTYVITPSVNEALLSLHYRAWDGLSTQTILRFLTNSTTTVQLHINRTAAGALEVYRGATLLGSTAALLTSASTWYGLEIRVLFDNAAGELEIVIDGVQALLVTAVDTQDTAFADCTGFAVLANGSFRWAFDNLVFRDFTAQPTLYGTFQVLAFMPNGAGDETDFTPSAGSNYQCVDEIPSDGDTSHVESSTVGHKDLYDIADHGILAGVVLAVQVHHIARKTDGAAREFRALIKHDVTEDTGATNALSASFTRYSALFDDCPGETGWDLAQLDALQIGQEVVT